MLRWLLMIAVPSRPPRGVVTVLLAALFRRHARAYVSVVLDANRDPAEAPRALLHAVDLALVDDRSDTPLLAVEVRDRNKRSARLATEHDWPCTWIVHAERSEIEVVRPGTGSVVYREGTGVPLPAELDSHGLRALPVTACFDAREAFRYNDGWVQAQGVLTVLAARGLEAPQEVRTRVLAAPDAATLVRWLTLAATAPSMDAFVAGLR